LIVVFADIIREVCRYQESVIAMHCDRREHLKFMRGK